MPGEIEITEHYLTETEPTLHYLSQSRSSENAARPALILLHGAASHAYYWQYFMPDFADDYDMYALDLRGHGDSAYAARYDAIEDYVADLGRLVAAINPSRFSLVGHSLGGFVAMAYAVTRSDARLDKVVICEIKSDMNAEERQGMQRAAARPQPQFASLEELSARFIATLKDSTADHALLTELAHLGSRQNENGTYSFKYDRRALDFPRPEPERYAAMLKLPTLVINGQQSQMVSGADAARQTAALLHGRQHEIANAGHHAFLDQTAEFSRAVRQFLDSADQKA